MELLQKDHQKVDYQNQTGKYFNFLCLHLSLAPMRSDGSYGTKKKLLKNK